MLKPLLFGADSGHGSELHEIQALLDRRSRYVQLLKDLELDFSTGKVSESDYQQQKNSMMIEFAELLGQIEKQGSQKNEPQRLQG